MLLDQRGCGRSLPHASAPDADLTTNTTWHLVADLERLRDDRGIERWQVFGGSWGSALALAYAETHPERVTELILRGIFTLRRSELDFYYNGRRGQLFPERYAEFLAPLGGRGVPRRRRSRPTTSCCSTPTRRCTGRPGGLDDVGGGDDHPGTRRGADRASSPSRRSRWPSPGSRTTTSPTAAGSPSEGQLIADAHRLADIPGVIVQGRYDVATPAVTAYDLHLAWPQADFAVVPDGRSRLSEPGILATLVAATDRFAATPL